MNFNYSMACSEYYSSLKGDMKYRYDLKLLIIDNVDPYSLSASELTSNLSFLPTVSIMDMVNYLILTHSFYTGQQLKAYKSLQAYKYYEAGFVVEVLAKRINENCFVVVGKVKHSQRTREKALHVWVIVLLDGAISCAHCTCMAGLSEVCSHVAAVLFYLEARPSSEEVSCTETLARWPVPSTKTIDMVRVRDMDWTRKAKPMVLPQGGVPALEDESLVTIIRGFLKLDVRPAIATVYEPFVSEMYKPPKNLPNGLVTLFNNDLKGCTYKELASQQIDLTISKEHIKEIESATRDQAQNNIWFKYRAGRITASKFKAACRAKLEKPPLSLIKGVCYPQKVIFFSKQTSYGIKYEKLALEEYFTQVKKYHEGISLKPAGFFISHEHPQFGASPDGIVQCECCGLGCVEVKCPYFLKELSMPEFAKKKNTCLLYHNDNEFSLDKNHVYYYQMQLQMFVTKTKYCDFVIWSNNCMYIDRVGFNEEFFNECLMKSLDFHKYVITPELLARFFTTKCGVEKVEMWCICKTPDDGRPMLKCDNDDCVIGWFHFDCIGMVEEPQNAWFCDTCQ